MIVANTKRVFFSSGFSVAVAAALAKAVAVAIVAAGVSSCGTDPVREGAATLYKRPAGQALHDTTPLRGERGALRLHRDGNEEKCSACHEGFSRGQGDVALQGEHGDITFDHGLNVLCLNCHHPENSDVYVYHDGSEIPGDEPNQLCAKCHGPHFRDFNLGVHGRMNGYWSAELGPQTRLACIQCHDPHRPAFPGIQPEPAPGLTRFSSLSPGV